MLSILTFAAHFQGIVAFMWFMWAVDKSCGKLRNSLVHCQSMIIPLTEHITVWAWWQQIALYHLL